VSITAPAPARPVLHRVHDILAAARTTWPEHAALRYAGRTWSYTDLAGYAEAAAGCLAGHGVRPGDRVLVRLPNRPHLVPLLFALARLGAVFVPINPAMKEFHLLAVVADAEPVLAVVETGQAGAVPGVPTVELDRLWAEVLDRPTAVPSGWPEPTPEHPAIFIYTSGSTAAPKAVILPHAQVSFAAQAIQAVLGYRPDDVVFCRVPMSFDYGLYQLLLTALAGAELVLAAEEPEVRLLAQVRAAGATVFPAVPSLAGTLVKLVARDPGPTRLRMFTNTGAALPQAVIDGLRAGFPDARVVRMYGTTECKRITIMPPAEEYERPGSVGPALPGTRVLVVDAGGEPLPAGEVGEIVVTGPHVMAGYHNQPELTARTFRAAAAGGVRLHTGDYGWLDPDGYLYFAGRRDDMFKRKGTRMSSLEIEAAAMDIAGVRAAAVLPPGDGHDLAIFVATELDPTTVLRELANRLEPAKVPAICRVLAELPLTANGKSARQQLVALLAGVTR